MKSRMIHFVAAIGVFATFVTSTTCVSAAETPAAIPPPGELPAACRKAKAEFRPLTQADVERAKNVLSEALDRLDQRLTLAGSNGENWRHYLEVADLKGQLRRHEGPDKEVLAGIWARYNSGYEGLELVWFLDVQKGLQNYLAMAGAVNNPKIRSDFESKLDMLAGSLEKYAAKPTTEDALVISESLRWLENAQQTPALVQAIEHYYVQPNVFGEMSPGVVAVGIAEPVDDTLSIRDCILGTDLYGTAHTVGRTSIELSPDPNRGVLDTLFFGTTKSENVGYHGPVTIYNTATTSLAARKRLFMDVDGLSACPAVSNAVTEVRICDIQSNKGRQMVERMAWKRAEKQQCEAESIASRHAEARLNERVDQQAADPVDRANRAYIDKFHRPFTDRKLFPQMLRFSTTERALSIAAYRPAARNWRAGRAAPGGGRSRHFASNPRIGHQQLDLRRAGGTNRLRRESAGGGHRCARPPPRENERRRGRQAVGAHLRPAATHLRHFRRRRLRDDDPRGEFYQRQGYGQEHDHLCSLQD